MATPQLHDASVRSIFAKTMDVFLAMLGNAWQFLLPCFCRDTGRQLSWNARRLSFLCQPNLRTPSISKQTKLSQRNWHNSLKNRQHGAPRPRPVGNAHRCRTPSTEASFIAVTINLMSPLKNAAKYIYIFPCPERTVQSAQLHDLELAKLPSPRSQREYRNK